MLRHNLELFDALQRQIEACDVQVEACLADLARRAAPAAAALPAERSHCRPRGNEPHFDLRTPLHRLAGTDLSQLDDIGPYNALRLLSEIGTDMSRWPSQRHFTSWLTWRRTTRSQAAACLVLQSGSSVTYWHQVMRPCRAR